ncbi:hypothetical protein [Helicobacter monodelphidis]|uniref:hypothetical protein n=1 Tax=Helicobacter sp. 15-1451 TaxID=2004995 RepID=UPI0011BEF794|nr:hypothetical protein [Helicobacter sp. 15-1451]
MNIVYAPTKRCGTDFIHQNIDAMFDVMLLENVLGIQKVKKILYLPNAQTTQTHSDIVLESLATNSVQQIASLKEAQKTAFMLTDSAYIALPYTLYFQKPVIFALLGFTGLDIQNDRLFAILKKCSFFVYSYHELNNTIQQIQKFWVAQKEEYETFLEGSII